MLLTLPNELLAIILGLCDGRTRLRLDCCHSRLKRLVQANECKLTRLNLQHDLDLIKFVTFEDVKNYLIGRYPLLRQLNLRGVPTSINARALRDLLTHYPKLETIDLSQQYSFPRLALTTLTALDFGLSLNNLYLDNIPVKVEHGDRRRPLLLPSMNSICHLHSLSLDNSSLLAYRIMQIVIDIEVKMRLQKLKLGNSKSRRCLQPIELNMLYHFLDRSIETLTEIHMCGYIVRREADAEFLMRLLLRINNLKRLHLDGLQIRDTVHRTRPIRDYPCLPSTLEYLEIINSDYFYTNFIVIPFQKHCNLIKLGRFLDRLYPDGIIIR